MAYPAMESAIPLYIHDPGNVCIGVFQIGWWSGLQFSSHHWSLCECYDLRFHGSLGKQSLVTLHTTIVQFEHYLL